MGVRGEAIGIYRPGYVIGMDGEPMAVLVDIATWRALIRRLEDAEDMEALRNIVEDLRALAEGVRPTGWKSWEEFELELEALDATEEPGEVSG